MCYFAFPDYANLPPLAYQVANVFRVSSYVSADLVLPVIDPAGGKPSLPAVVAVPEATVDEDYLAPRPEHEVGAPGQVAPVETVAIAHPVQEPAHGHFGAGVLLPNRGHYP